MKPKIVRAVIFLLLLSIIKYFFRFYRLAYFEHDQEYLAAQAKMILVDKHLTLIGAPTSVGGMFIGPAYNYFMAFIFWLTSFNPYSVAFVGNLWAVATIIAIFLVTRKLFDQKTAWFASGGALLSISFLNQAALPPLVEPIPLVSLLLLWLVAQKKPNLVWIAILIGLSFNLHFTAIFFIPMVVIGLAINKKKQLDKDQYLKSFLILSLMILPLALFELRHNFFITKNLFSFLSSGVKGNLALQSLRTWGIGLEAAGNLLFSSFQRDYKYLTSVIFVVGFWALRKNRRDLLVLWWFLSPIIFFSFYKNHIINYYFSPSEPVFFIMVGTVLARIFCFRLGRVAAIGYLALVLAINFLAWYYNRSHHSLFYKLQALDFIREKTNNQLFYLSYTIDYPWRGGWDYLAWYYKFNLAAKPNPQVYPTYTLIQPKYWKGIKSDFTFGDIGVGVPR